MLRKIDKALSQSQSKQTNKKKDQSGGKEKKKCLCVCQLCPTLCHSMDCSAACQAHLPLEFSKQGYCSGLSCPSPGDFPDSEINPRSPVLQADSHLSNSGSPNAQQNRQSSKTIEEKIRPKNPSSVTNKKRLLIKQIIQKQERILSNFLKYNLEFLYATKTN